MKRVLTIVGMISAIAFSHSVSSQCKTPEPFDPKASLGIWNGAYTSNGQLHEFSIEIGEENGNLSVDVDLPGRLENEFEFSIKTCKSQDLHIKCENSSLAMEFIGKPENGGTMSGRVVVRENGKLVAREVFALRNKAVLASN